jgi:predicted hydrocarbon binding protein
MKHQQKWIVSLMDSLDALVDEKTRVRVLENCGRNCIPRSFVKRAKTCKEGARNNDEFLERLSKVWRHLQRDGDKVYVVYEKCYCPLVKAYPDKLSPTFCNCSRGWVKELFESVLEKPVNVVLEKSIKQGNDICKFRVCLPSS